MYSRNCGKSRTNTNHANVIRHYQHAGEQEGWEFRSCVTFQVQSNIGCNPFCSRYTKISPRFCVSGLLRTQRPFCNLLYFLVAVPRRAIKILLSHSLREIRLPRIFLAKIACALKTPPRNAAFSPLSFLHTANNLHSKQLSRPQKSCSR